MHPALPPRIYLFSLLLTFPILLGCHTSSPQPASFFPIGIFGVPQTNLTDIKAAGFNIVIGPATSTYLDAANAAGLEVLAQSSPFQVLTNSAAANRIIDLDRHPALWGWYSIDEPDLNRIPPATVAKVHKKLNRLARKPAVLVLMSGTSVIHYRDLPDAIAVDFYPVPWAPLSQFGKEMKLARYAFEPKPYYAILQAFDWSAFPDFIDTTETLRAPSYDELRCMVYMALAQRAQGLFFYTYSARGWDLTKSPLWTDLQFIVAEINLRLPLFTAENLWWSPDFDYLAGPDSMYNEVRDGKISLVLLQVRKGNAAVPPGRYALAINTTSESVPFELQLPHTGDTVPVLGASSPIPLTAGSIRKTFGPYEVICFGPMR